MVKSLSSEVADSVSKVSTTLEGVVKSSLHDIERRRKPRYSMRIPGRVMAATGNVDMIVENLSEGGALLRGEAPDVSRGQQLEVKLHGFTDALPCEVRNRRDGALHVKFHVPADKAARFQDEFRKAIQGKRELAQAA